MLDEMQEAFSHDFRSAAVSYARQPIENEQDLSSAVALLRDAGASKENDRFPIDKSAEDPSPRNHTQSRTRSWKCAMDTDCLGLRVGTHGGYSLTTDTEPKHRFQMRGTSINPCHLLQI
jgi:hypothetical protein